MTPPTPEPVMLHVYGPYAHHDDAYVVGTRAGLTALRDALSWLLEAQAPGTGAGFEAFVADGEGFTLTVWLESEDGLDAYVLPYTAAYAVPPPQTEPYNPDWPRKRPRQGAQES